MRRYLAAVSFLAVVSPAFAGVTDVQLPPRRAGLWETTINMGSVMPNTGPITNVSKNCIDRNTDKEMMLRGMSRLNKMKGAMSITGGGNHFQMKSTANVGDRKLMVTEDISYVSDTEIRTSVRTDLEPPMPNAAAMSPREMKVESKWVGPCPAGVQPGDAIVGGHTIHVLKGDTPGQ